MHLTKAVDGWFLGATIEEHDPKHRPWRMYEFSLGDPDGILVRVGWPTRLDR